MIFVVLADVTVQGIYLSTKSISSQSRPSPCHDMSNIATFVSTDAFVQSLFQLLIPNIYNNFLPFGRP